MKCASQKGCCVLKHWAKQHSRAAQSKHINTLRSGSRCVIETPKEANEKENEVLIQTATVRSWGFSCLVHIYFRFLSTVFFSSRKERMVKIEEQSSEALRQRSSLSPSVVPWHRGCSNLDVKLAFSFWMEILNCAVPMELYVLKRRKMSSSMAVKIIGCGTAIWSSKENQQARTSSFVFFGTSINLTEVEHNFKDLTIFTTTRKKSQIKALKIALVKNYMN